MDGSKILIVDDEPSIRIMLARMIESLRHVVHVAEDGLVALKKAKAERYDLIVTDLRMPNMDGLTLLESAREAKIDAAFIILTGFGDLPQALNARDRFNISNFLIKPIHNIDQFLFDIESAISRRRLEHENQTLMENLRRMNADLEAMVQQRTQELEEKNRELLGLSNFRGDILKVLGHELRTPLAILAGYHHLAVNGGCFQFDTLAAQMSASIDRLREIVEKALLQLQSSEQVSFRLELEEVAPEDLCNQVIERIRPFLNRRRITIRLIQQPETVMCSWDREKIEVLIEELLINAIRATPDGNSIDVTIATQNELVDILVRDRGVGIPPDQLSRVFEPFITLGSAAQHKSGLFEFGAAGIGIGLPTARIWAELHHGSVSAHPNDDGPGSTLALHLPRTVSPHSGRASEQTTEVC